MKNRHRDFSSSSKSRQHTSFFFFLSILHHPPTKSTQNHQLSYRSRFSIHCTLCVTLGINNKRTELTGKKSENNRYANYKLSIARFSYGKNAPVLFRTHHRTPRTHTPRGCIPTRKSYVRIFTVFPTTDY